MAKKYLDGDGLLYLWQKITNQFVKKDGTKVLSTNDYTTDEKNKLAGIETGATKVTVDTELSSTSTNPVQNKVINTALAGKVNTVSGKGLSTNDLTDELLTKLNNTATKVEEIATVGGEPNIIETVKVNGEILDVTDKTVDIVIPESDQADWSQNDETAASYVKNRPFYEETETTETTLLAEGDRTLEVTDAEMGFYAYYYTTEEAAIFSNLGDCSGTLVVTINNVSEEAQFSITNGKFDSKVISFRDTGLAHSIDFYHNRVEVINPKTEIANNNYIVNLSAVLKAEVVTGVVKIDEKFLPDTVVFEDELVQSDWNQNDSTKPDYIKNRICYENVISSTEQILWDEAERDFYQYNDNGWEYTATSSEKSELRNNLDEYLEINLVLTIDNVEYKTIMRKNGPGDFSHDPWTLNGNEVPSLTLLIGGTQTWLSGETLETNISIGIHTVSLKMIIEEVEVITIPEKYLPDTVVLESEISTVASSGSYNDLTNTPTNVSVFTNDSNYQNETQVNALIANAIGDITGISYEIVTSLPTTGEAGVIYLLSNNGANPNIYDEYIYTNGSFEKIGTTDVDLSGYVQDSDLVAITNSEIDTLIAG